MVSSRIPCYIFFGMWWNIDGASQGNEALCSSKTATGWLKWKMYEVYMLTLDAMKSCHMVVGNRLLYLEVWSMKEDLSVH